MKRKQALQFGTGDGLLGRIEVDADDGAAEPLFIRTDLGGQIRERRLAAMLAAKLFAGGLDFAALAPHATSEGVRLPGACWLVEANAA